MIKKFTLLLAAVLAFCVQPSAQLDETDTGSIIKASYIYNFAKLVDWTETKSDPQLVVSVLGDSNLYKQLVKRYAGKQIGNQTVEIKMIAEVSGTTKAHILFVPRKKKDVLGTICSHMAGKNTLVISETPDGLSEGAVINFVTVSNNLKFEINESNAASQKLVIGNTLKSLAVNK